MEHNKKCFEKMTAEGCGAQEIVGMLLSDMIEDIAEEWGYEITSTTCAGDRLTVQTYGKHGAEFEIGKNGIISKIRTTTRETGGVTWNGDDMYYKNVETVLLSSEEVDTVENYPALLTSPAITFDALESTACEIVSAICN